LAQSHRRAASNQIPIQAMSSFLVTSAVGVCHSHLVTPSSSNAVGSSSVSAEAQAASVASAAATAAEPAATAASSAAIPVAAAAATAAAPSAATAASTPAAAPAEALAAAVALSPLSLMDGCADNRHSNGHEKSVCSDGIDASTVKGSSVSSAFDSDSSVASNEGGAPLRRYRVLSLHNLLESGVLSAVIFLGAMLIYNAAVPVCQVGYDVWCSWLYFWGAAVFIAEAVVEIVYCMQFPPERLTQKRDVASVGDQFRAVNWELWSAVFFMIPSIFYLAEALVDPNIVGQHPAQALRQVGVDDSKFITVCDWCAVSLFVLDAILRYCARWCIDSELDASSRLIRFRVWTASSFHSIDWVFWGDVMFVAAAVLGVFIKFYSTLALSAISSGSWTFDAVLYLNGAVSEWRSRKDDDAIEEVCV